MPTSSRLTMFSCETLLAASASRLNRRTNSSSGLVLRPEHLDGHSSFSNFVVGAIDHRHAAGSDDGFDDVSARRATRPIIGDASSKMTAMAVMLSCPPRVQRGAHQRVEMLVSSAHAGEASTSSIFRSSTQLDSPSVHSRNASPGRQSSCNQIHLHRLRRAQRAGDVIALGMGRAPRCAVMSPLHHHFLHQRVIRGHAHDRAVADADRRGCRPRGRCRATFPSDAQAGEGGAHAAALAVVRRIDLQHRRRSISAAHRFVNGRGARPARVAHDLGERRNGQRAGDLARVVSAHAVGYGAETLALLGEIDSCPR